MDLKTKVAITREVLLRKNPIYFQMRMYLRFWGDMWDTLFTELRNWICVQLCLLTGRSSPSFYAPSIFSGCPCHPCFQTDRPPLSELSRLSSAAITFCLLRSVQGLDQPLLLTHGQIYKHKHTDIHTQSHAEMYRNIHRSTLSLIYMYVQYHTFHISDIWLQWQIF